MKTFDVHKIRSDFPILSTKIHGRPLVYLDNAATSQKPRSVIERMNTFYKKENSNVHRAVYSLSDTATKAYEDSREKVRKFLNAKKAPEIVFTEGTTDGINLIASSFGRKYVTKGNEILISEMEHHSNIVPWQLLCEQTGAVLKVIPMNDRGELDMSRLKKLLTKKVKLLALVHVSNSLGTINPVQEIVKLAHAKNIPVLLDGAQVVPHLKVDVQKLDCDFYVFSGHKVFGPTGIGVLYGKEKWLSELPPYQGGGDMIKSVTFAKTTYNDLPYKFEAGTPNIAGAVGLGEALEYFSSFDMPSVEKYEQELLKYASVQLEKIPEVTIIGTAKNKVPVISFVVEGIHPHDVGTCLDEDGVAIRTGHHCTQPVMQHFKIPATCRISLGFYNTKQELDVFVRSLRRTIKIFKK